MKEIKETALKIQKLIYLTRDEIEKRVNMNIPTTHKDKYLDLLYKYRSVISKDISDLGMAKNFFSPHCAQRQAQYIENNTKFQNLTA